MQKIALSIVVAMTPERVIGNEGKLLWRLPSDLARFKEITMRAGTVVMGRKTYESILDRNGEPLRERKHIVLTKKGAMSPDYKSVHFAESLQEACMDIVKYGNNACIIGGGEIYRLFLSIPQVTSLFITTVYTPKKLSGDVYFPEIPAKAGWKCEKSSAIQRWNPFDEYDTSFALYKRS